MFWFGRIIVMLSCGVSMPSTTPPASTGVPAGVALGRTGAVLLLGAAMSISDTSLKLLLILHPPTPQFSCSFSLKGAFHRFTWLQ